MSDYLPTMAEGTVPVAPATSVTTLRVVHLSGSHAGTTQELTPGTALVGRHPESRVRFDHTTDFLVSTRHGQFEFDQGQWYFVDTNSTNGTWVNGARVQRQALTQGLLVILGTPGAAGSASFKIDFDGTAAVGTPVDAAFAQEPPSSGELIKFVCQACGAVDTAPAVEIGQAVDCGICGKKTKVVPMSPGQAPPRSSAGAPPVIGGTASKHPPAVVPEDAGFFGGIIGNVKGAIQRMKERKELDRDIASLEQQLPSLEAGLQQACTALGNELWQAGSAAHEALKSFRATEKLAGLDAGVEQVKGKRKAAEDDAATRANEHQHWLEDWQARHAALEADLALASQTLADAKAEQARSRDAVKAAAAARADGLTAVAAIMNDLAAEARGEPKDDYAARYAAGIADASAKLTELSAPIDGWSEKVASRTAAAVALDAATAAHGEATAKVAASNQEKSSQDASRAQQERTHQQQLQAMTQEVDRIRGQAPPLHADLGRQYIETAGAPAIDPAPASLSAARAALDRIKQSQATIAQKKQRLAELK